MHIYIALGLGICISGGPHLGVPTVPHKIKAKPHYASNEAATTKKVKTGPEHCMTPILTRECSYHMTCGREDSQTGSAVGVGGVWRQEAGLANERVFFLIAVTEYAE